MEENEIKGRKVAIDIVKANISGIQSVCMKLAFRMCKFYPELMDELKRTLKSMEIDYYKPAVKCVRSRILISYTD